MGRKRNNKTAWWVAVPLWGVVAALVSWGIWQAVVFRNSMVAEARAKTVVDVAPPAETAPSDTPDAIASAPDELLKTQAVVTGDEWAAASTPASEAALESPLGANEKPVAMTPPAQPGSVSVDDLLVSGAANLDAGRIVEGRTALNTALGMMGDDPRAAQLRGQLTSLNAGIFLGSSVIPEDPAARLVQIAPGDSFLKLGKTYAIPAALLETINPGLNPRNLKPLTGVKIVQGPFHLRVFKRAGRIDLYARDLYVRSFAGAVEEGNYLPVGTYRISAASKIKVGAKVWVGIEGTPDSGGERVEGWLYGDAGPRNAERLDRVSGVKMADTELSQLYNVVVEGRSLVRVEP